jgi:hypothetical protein
MAVSVPSRATQAQGREDERRHPGRSRCLKVRGHGWVGRTLDSLVVELFSGQPWGVLAESTQQQMLAFFWLQHVRDNTASNGLKFIFLLLGVPCFQASHFCFTHPTCAAARRRSKGHHPPVRPALSTTRREKKKVAESPVTLPLAS